MYECLIREAQLSDAPAVARLITQLGYPVLSEDMAGRLELLISMPEYITYVAEVQGNVVGLVGAYMGYSLEFTGMYGRLTALVVDEKWRSREIGRRLMDRIETCLKDKGALLIVLTSSNHRAKSHRFYRNIGYEGTGIRFTKRL